MDVKKDENSILENMKQEINHSLKEEAQEEEEILKKRISSHPLYGLLLHSHLNCLKEAYCSTLRELKEAMEKPLTETHRFVDAVYTQLNDIVMSSPP
ncbi:KNOX meinox protein [Arabidopsis thaliana]|uniref:Isoform KNATM-C of Protein KNATM n=1 Tax=Arabidopsis thaliana TaxID=3702 RepID=F4HXU3-3|nr:KNOX meinox protein [Arabidopsis thaliana]AEE29222.1 KNOX meinox protein [Arabidopsis thaliana]|eukprot:NP_001154341.1 KNOX meinox protein [Arabidopsis thaliana]